MDQRDVRLRSVKENTFISTYEREKGFKKIATVEIDYHEITLLCDLVVVQKTDKTLFYFLSMPHRIFKSNKEKISKFNLCNWQSKEISDKFQIFCLKLLGDAHPQLFQKDPFGKKSEKKDLANG